MPAATKANSKTQKRAPKKVSAKSRVAGNAAVQPPGPPLLLKLPAQARRLPAIRAIQAIQEEEESSSSSESEVIHIHTSEEETNGEEEDGEEEEEEPEPLPKKRKRARRATANKKKKVDDDDEIDSKIGYQLSIFSIA